MMSRARTPGMRAHCRARRTHRDLPPDGPVIQTGGLFAQEQDSEARAAARLRPSWRARFSAATRAYLGSVPDPPG